MIIQVRGTSGSGKSTVMREVMKALGEPEVQYVTGRKRPQRYFFDGLVYVLGHYESACGGCDTIGSARAVHDLTRLLLDGPDNARVVLAEGLLLSEDVKWTARLAEEGEDVRCLFLTTPLDRCLRQIEARRAEAGNAKPLDRTNTVNRVRTIERARVKLLGAGVMCRRCSPEQAPGIVLRWARGASCR